MKENKCAHYLHSVCSECAELSAHAVEFPRVQILVQPLHLSLIAPFNGNTSVRVAICRIPRTLPVTAALYCVRDQLHLRSPWQQIETAL